MFTTDDDTPAPELFRSSPSLTPVGPTRMHPQLRTIPALRSRLVPTILGHTLIISPLHV